MSEENVLKYNIEEKFWRVIVRSSFDAKKIKMVDADGVEWYRYPDGRNTYIIDEVEIVGRLFFRIEGESALWEEEEYVGRYAIRVNNQFLEEAYEDDFDSDRVYPAAYFCTREEAEAYVAEMKVKE